MNQIDFGKFLFIICLFEKHNRKSEHDSDSAWLLLAMLVCRGGGGAGAKACYKLMKIYHTVFSKAKIVA